MINGECFGGNAFSNYISPIEDFNSIFLVLSGVLLIYAFFRVKSKRKKGARYSTIVDSSQVDILMQPHNEELLNVNSDKLPFVGQNISPLKSLMLLVVFLIIASIINMFL